LDEIIEIEALLLHVYNRGRTPVTITEGGSHVRFGGKQGPIGKKNVVAPGVRLPSDWTLMRP